MTKIKTQLSILYERYKHLLLLLYFPVYLIWFAYVEENVTTHFHVIHVTLDDYIPFCEYFVIPYFLWFGYVAWAFLYFGFHDRTDFCKLCAFLFTGMTVFLLISTFYPNGHYLRPQYFTHHNFCTMLVDQLYATDTATNLFPSIHVYNSMGVHLAVCESKEFKNHKTVRLLSGVLMISIVLATMFLKQHSVFDVLTAFLLAGIMYLVVYVKKWNKTSQELVRKKYDKKRVRL